MATEKKTKKTKEPMLRSRTTRVVETVASVYVLALIARVLVGVGRVIVKKYFGA